MSDINGYDGAVAQLVKDFTLCAGCMDEIVVGSPEEPVLCPGCKKADEELDWVGRSERRLEQSRVQAGVVELTDRGDLPERCLAAATMGQLVAAAIATVIGGLTLSFLLGWYGLRALAALGIWMAR